MSRVVRSRLLGSIVATALLMQAAPEARADEPYVDGAPVPPGYRIENKREKVLIIGGSVSFGVAWVVTALASTLGNAFSHLAVTEDGSGSSQQTNWVLGYIPIVGPIGVLATQPSAEQSPGMSTFMASSSVIQAGGAAMLIAGIALGPKKYLVEDAKREFHILPIAGPQVAGIQVSGTF